MTDLLHQFDSDVSGDRLDRSFVPFVVEHGSTGFGVFVNNCILFWVKIPICVPKIYKIFSEFFF